MSRHRSSLQGAVATGARATGAAATGAFSVGAMALGAVAVGAFAIGRLAIGRARIGRIEIGELVVDRLEIGTATTAGIATLTHIRASTGKGDALEALFQEQAPLAAGTIIRRSAGNPDLFLLHDEAQNPSPWFETVLHLAAERGLIDEDAVETDHFRTIERAPKLLDSSQS